MLHWIWYERLVWKNGCEKILVLICTFATLAGINRSKIFLTIQLFIQKLFNQKNKTKVQQLFTNLSMNNMDVKGFKVFKNNHTRISF